jgi:hypothetical protein
MTETDAAVPHRDVAGQTDLRTADHLAACRSGVVPARRTSCCAHPFSRSWSPPPLPSDTQLKRLVDRFLPRAGLPVVAYFAAVIGALNLASLFSSPVAELALEGAAALAAGAWCALNFWRCRHAHCLVTGAGWLGLGLLALVGAGLGHSVVGGHERGAFVAVLAIGCLFEAAWQITQGTNAMTRARGDRRRREGDLRVTRSSLI